MFEAPGMRLNETRISLTRRDISSVATSLDAVLGRGLAEHLIFMTFEILSPESNRLEVREQPGYLEANWAE